MGELRVQPKGTGEIEPVQGPWEEQRPVVYIERPSRAVNPLDLLLRLLAGLVLLLVVALLGAMLFLVVSLTASISGLGGGLGNLGGAVGNAGAAIGAAAQQAGQDLVDRLDPAHPPRISLYQDTEFEELKLVAEGGSLGRIGEYSLTLSRIEKRQDAAGPGEAQYAVLHRRLEAPRQTRLGPLVVREDWDEADYYLYKGESFRLGRVYYKVNWVSVDRQEMALARYRAVDGLAVPLKFQLD